MKKVGIQKGLTNVSDHLRRNGYSVHEIGENFENNASSLNGFDAIIIADYNDDMMGFSDTSTKVPIINADGLTPEDVKCLLDQKITK